MVHDGAWWRANEFPMRRMLLSGDDCDGDDDVSISVVLRSLIRISIEQSLLEAAASYASLYLYCIQVASDATTISKARKPEARFCKRN